MKRTLVCWILLALPGFVFSQSPPAGNVKTWNVRVSIEGHFREDNPGWYHKVDLRATITGTITDNMMIAGGHYAWPMPSPAEAMNPESARRLTTTLQYEEITHQEGSGAAMPETHEVCKGSTAKGGIALSLPPATGKWGTEINISEINLSCKGGAEQTKEAGVITLAIPDQQLPTNLSEIKGTKRITTLDGREYTVTYSFKPGTRD